MKQWPVTNAGWRDYYAKRWERNQRASTMQLALFYHFMLLLETGPGDA